MEYSLYFVGLFLMTVGAADTEPTASSLDFHITVHLSISATTPVIHNYSMSVLCNDRVYKTYRDGKVIRPDWVTDNTSDSFVVTVDSITEKEKDEFIRILQVMTHNQSIMKYSYDGEDLISFDVSAAQWVPEKKEVTAIVEQKNTETFYNVSTSVIFGFLCGIMKETGECPDDIIQNPDISAFIQNSYKPHRLLLTCMATGFFPKNITMNIRKNQTQLPSEELRSLGVRPNNDGTYQLRKSVEIPDSDEKDYDCYVDHITLKEPVTLGFKYLRDSDPPRPSQ
ncbi:BOLA class I histocompatibility antigen, alpha chain BL3-6 isoform X2 [Chanos chanos]|uniref:BOLA class I histocompatibility antigen, alpha chain BL3-6 isoform X2 n=1 Tax=Chanos chanos TaxID=29144 RepID=A0A6J2WJT9_CHACN|nr:BOLA class I histocompatibility antigen, alpha chain BL3-6-like isoform X2 [Chanos chanos]